MTSRSSDLPGRVILLCGPPCAGKTTAAHALATGPSDLVVDFDEVARDLGSPTRWMHPEPYRTRAEVRTAQLLAQLPGSGPGTAYVIRCLPRPQARAIASRMLGGATTYVLDPGIDECLRRATVDGRPDGTAEEIRSWYARYRSWSGDHESIGIVVNS